MDFWIRGARTSTQLKVRNEVITENVEVTQTILQGLENTFKLCEYVVRVENKRWHRRIMIWSPERRRGRGRTEVKWKGKLRGL